MGDGKGRDLRLSEARQRFWVRVQGHGGALCPLAPARCPALGRSAVSRSGGLHTITCCVSALGRRGRQSPQGGQWHGNITAPLGGKQPDQRCDSAAWARLV